MPDTERVKISTINTTSSGFVIEIIQRVKISTINTTSSGFVIEIIQRVKILTINTTSSGFVIEITQLCFPVGFYISVVSILPLVHY